MSGCRNACEFRECGAGTAVGQELPSSDLDRLTELILIVKVDEMKDVDGWN
jgi:hypothetical protein